MYPTPHNPLTHFPGGYGQLQQLISQVHLDDTYIDILWLLRQHISYNTINFKASLKPHLTRWTFKIKNIINTSQYTYYWCVHSLYINSICKINLKASYNTNMHFFTAQNILMRKLHQKVSNVPWQSKKIISYIHYWTICSGEQFGAIQTPGNMKKLGAI